MLGLGRRLRVCLAAQANTDSTLFTSDAAASTARAKQAVLAVPTQGVPTPSVAAVPGRTSSSSWANEAKSPGTHPSPHRAPRYLPHCQRFDRVITAFEQPARVGFVATKEVLLITGTLGRYFVKILVEYYVTYLHGRLLRFVVGIPIVLATMFILVMHQKYFPESPAGLSTASVAGLPLCDSVDELLDYALSVRRNYRAASHHASLSATDRNEVLRGVLVLIRSLETVLVGSMEERQLIEPRLDLAGASVRPTSPAEFALRVVLSIALEQGWFDVVEAARKLFAELVSNNPLPMQARVVEAVGDLCALSYELENCRVSAALTRSQRKRVARAIDTFRPERAVEERCTISAEISVLPLSDGDGTTRCLSMIRRSPGRKPQLIMCFVGSNSKSNWLTNFNYWARPLPAAAFGVKGGAMVHRGFFHLAETIPYRDVAQDFDQIILVGHSLGGALAQLAGLRLAAERPSRRITVVTMASPRVLAIGPAAKDPASAATLRRPFVNSDAALAERLTLPDNYRHFRGFLQPDIVTQLPPNCLGYTHVGRRIPLQTGCTTFPSLIAWGMWSMLFHSSDLYTRVLANPLVVQTHVYRPSPTELELQHALQAEAVLPEFSAAW